MALFRSNLVTLLVRFRGFDLKDRFEKKFCINKKNNNDYQVKGRNIHQYTLDDDVRLSNEPENTSGNRAIDSSSLMAFSQDFFIIFIDSKGTEKNTTSHSDNNKDYFGYRKIESNPPFRLAIRQR